MKNLIVRFPLFAFMVAPFLNAAADNPAAKPAPAADTEVVEVAINAPATHYGIKLVEIRKVGEELWVLSKVEMAGEVGGDAITKVSDKVEIAKQGLPVKHFIVGKTWGWADPDTVTYLPGAEMTDEKWDTGTPIWKRPEVPAVPTFEEWVKGGKKIPQDRVFLGGSPWFNESTGKNRTPEEVYEMLYGK